MNFVGNKAPSFILKMLPWKVWVWSQILAALSWQSCVCLGGSEMTRTAEAMNCDGGCIPSFPPYWKGVLNPSWWLHKHLISAFPVCLQVCWRADIRLRSRCPWRGFLPLRPWQQGTVSREVNPRSCFSKGAWRVFVSILMYSVLWKLGSRAAFSLGFVRNVRLWRWVFRAC